MTFRTIPLIAALFALTFALPADAATKKRATSAPAKSAPVRAKPVAKPEPVAPYTPSEDGTPPVVSAASAIVLDADSGQILHQLNADQARQVASTQKLLTALIIAESGNLDERIRVEFSDTQAEPSKLYLKPGEVYERGQLLRILLVKSMNDVARCLARDNAGSLEAFSAKMNAKARALGMSNSHFINPNGLPEPGQYSTARDMARVAMAAYRNGTIRGIVRLRALDFHYADGRVRNFTNTNQVLKNFPLCNGMKTGYTEAAGHCLISSASYNGRDVISVVLGDSKQIWVDSYRLLSWGLTM